MVKWSFWKTSARLLALPDGFGHTFLIHMACVIRLSIFFTDDIDPESVHLQCLCFGDAEQLSAQ